MKIVAFEAEERERGGFAALAECNELSFVEAPLSAANAADFAEAEVVSPFVYSRLDRAALERLPKLRLVATRSTGYDHVDRAFCAERGIALCNVPSYGENTVAEHVFALLLALSHRLPESLERARSGRFSPEGLQGFDLAGRSLGIVGTGSIGRQVARIARGFDMAVLACDPSPDPALAERLGFRYLELEALLAESDVVTLHAPATPQTEHLLDAAAFRRMKEGAVVINTARGSLIDSRALIQALRSGKLAGAGLDVLPEEPLIREEAELICSIFCERHDLRELVADHVLLRLPNVIVTPHSAFNTREAVGRIVGTTVANIRAFLDGRPQNLVIDRGGPGAVS